MSTTTARKKNAAMQGQIKLETLSVYNWGSFHGLHTVDIDAHGTLITGDNGSGKSTLIDGLMALLMPAGKTRFNVAAAQDNRADRDLMSYIRGNYGTAHDGARVQALQKREGATVSALRACYRTAEDQPVTLAALFWTTQPSMALADLNRLYITAQRELTLEEIFEAFDGGNVRELKRVLKADKAVTCHDNFSAYETIYRRLLYIANPNAPALLSRALGLKKIDDLTQLIRELVLEPSQVQEEARKAVSEFGDLEGIHEKLVDARNQRDTLDRLPQSATALHNAQEGEQRYTSLQSSLSAWFGGECARLYATRIEQLTQELTEASAELKTFERNSEDAAARVEQCHAAYLKAGGNQIEILRKDLQTAEQQLQEADRKAANYQQVARQLGLDDKLLPAVFETHQQQIDAALAAQETRKVELQQQAADAGIALEELRQQRVALDEEIAAIEARPDSNITPQFQKLRDEMQTTLNFEDGALMFIGELLDVKETDKAWQGAIERALGGLRTTLLIPADRYPMVTHWLNQRHTGLHVRVQVADSTVNKQAEFRKDGYLRKLDWRQHPYRDWLKRHLARFDLACVDSSATLDNTPFSLTQAGLIHREQGRFEKQDQYRVDARRHWQLGFSNKSRLALLQQEQRELAERQTAAEKTNKTAWQAWETLQDEANRWQKLAEFRWDEIDVPRYQARVKQLQTDLAAYESAGGELADSKARWEDAKSLLAEINEWKATQSKVVWALESRLKDSESALAKADTAAKSCEIEPDIWQRLHKMVGTLTEADLDNVRETEEYRRKLILQMQRKERDKYDQAKTRAVSIMSTFRRGWELIAGEWSADLNDLDNYLEHYTQLEKEGLPTLVEQFRERLNNHTAQSLASIRTQIDSEREDTQDRINTINTVLARTEFRPGSYLRLSFNEERYPHVKEFDRHLARVLGQAHDDEHELRFKRLEEIIATLDKASHPTTTNTLESRRLLDTRYRLSFLAEEIDRDSGDVKDVLKSSSGKSGGEKESFAGAIVAASLAYVLTPDGANAPVYCTVFLDEAFSNTAETVSRRVMRIFQELQIHINLITPYKNLNIARESARSLIIAERDADKHESRLCAVTWEELDRQQAVLLQESMPVDLVLEEA